MSEIENQKTSPPNGTQVDASGEASGTVRGRSSKRTAAPRRPAPGSDLGKAPEPRSQSAHQSPKLGERPADPAAVSDPYQRVRRIWPD